MKCVLLAACKAAPLAALVADAQAAQQQQMTACNKEAGTKELEGDARKKFMPECLSG